jgi:mannitol-specific phosphotransferase system IIBC component
MVKRLLAVVVLAIVSFSASIMFCEEKNQDELIAKLNDVRVKKAAITSEYKKGLEEVEKQADAKLTKIRAEFHAARDECLKDKNDKSNRLHNEYESKIKPVLEEEKGLIEVVGAKVGMNFAKPKSERK